jgi:hypothetical protein
MLIIPTIPAGAATTTQINANPKRTWWNSPTLLSISGMKVTNNDPITIPGIDVIPPNTGISKNTMDRSTVKLCTLTKDA